MRRQRLTDMLREDRPVTRSSNDIEPLPEQGAVGSEINNMVNRSTSGQSTQQAFTGVQGYPRGLMELIVDAMSAESYPIQETHHDGPVAHACTCSAFQLHPINRSVPSEPPLTEGRVCNGTYMWGISDFPQLLQDAIDGKMTYSESPAIYTELYGYKFCMRIYPNGVNEGVGRCLALYVRMMQGEYDDNMVWPFIRRISISVLDVGGAEFRDHINGTLLAKPNLRSFMRPTAANTLNRYGYQEFAPIQLVCSPQYLKQDTLQVNIEISKP